MKYSEKYLEQLTAGYEGSTINQVTSDELKRYGEYCSQEMLIEQSKYNKALCQLYKGKLKEMAKSDNL